MKLCARDFHMWTYERSLIDVMMRWKRAFFHSIWFKIDYFFANLINDVLIMIFCRHVHAATSSTNLWLFDLINGHVFPLFWFTMRLALRHSSKSVWFLWDFGIVKPLNVFIILRFNFLTFYGDKVSHSERLITST